MASLEEKEMTIPLTKGGLIVCLIKKKKEKRKTNSKPLCGREVMSGKKQQEQ